jgi:hypothetical protein
MLKTSKTRPLRHSRTSINFALLILVSVALSACGGGSGGSGVVSSVSGRVVDGYIGGAIVCVDENNNWQCDAGETQTTTLSDGSYFLPYAGSLDGKQIVSQVPIGATDTDFPGETILRPFTLVSPAEAASRTGPTAEVIVTPFTTMVSKEMSITGSSATVAASSVRQEFGLTESPLNYDFKAKNDRTALAAAQAITAAIAIVQETVVQSARVEGISLSPGEVAISASRIVKQEVAPALVKSDGSLAIQGCGAGGCKQAELASRVSSAATDVVQGISGRIQTIVAGTRSGSGKVADFKKVVESGLVFFEIDTSDFLFGSGNDQIRVTGNWNGYRDQLVVEAIQLMGDKLTTSNRKVHFDSAKNFKVSDFSIDRTRIPNPRDITVNPGWYKTWENVDAVTFWSATTGKWGERIEADGPDSGVEVEQNCVRLKEQGAGVSKACIVEKDLAGRPINDVFPGVCKKGSEDVVGCTPSDPMPIGSYGFNLQFEYTSDAYEIWASAEWDGYNYSGKNGGQGSTSVPPTLARFIEATSLSNPGSQQYTASCRVAFKIESLTERTGTFHWVFNRDESCSNNNQASWDFSKAEKTNYVIKEVAGKEVLEVFVPNVYRIANPGDMIANCKFAFAVVNRPVLKTGKSPYSMDPNDYEMPSTPLAGIYKGEFCPKSAKGVYEFTGNLNASGQAVSRIAAEHLAKQRGIPLDGLFPDK